MKVALVHDYLIQDGGAERVLLELHRLFPRAPIFTLFYDPERSHPDFKHADIRASKLNDLPFAQSHYEWYLPLMPNAIENIDVSGFDLVISSSSSFAKGVIASPHATHICYCHTPTRFLWQERLGYINELPQPRLVKNVLPHYLHKLRQWDLLAANRPDLIFTNSKTSQARIKRFYRRESQVIYPPVDVQQITPIPGLGQYWLAGGRFVSYKRFDLVVKAFAKLNLPLKIFGSGPEEKKLKQLAGPKTEFVGRIPERVKVELYQNCIGFIYPQTEDFGITAVEAMAAGKPVIAFGEGGATETVIPGVTGQFLDAQCWEDIGNAVIRFDPARYQAKSIRAQAERFSTKAFQDQFRQALEQAGLPVKQLLA